MVFSRLQTSLSPFQSQNRHSKLFKPASFTGENGTFEVEHEPSRQHKGNRSIEAQDRRKKFGWRLHAGALRLHKLVRYAEAFEVFQTCNSITPLHSPGAVAYLGYPSLHDEEVRIVDIQLHGMEEILDTARQSCRAIDGVLPSFKLCEGVAYGTSSAAQDGDERAHLSRDNDLPTVLVANGAADTIGIVEGDGDSSLGHAGLTLLVHQLLQRLGSHVLKVRNAEVEADGVEDVGFARAIEACDGIEVGVEARDRRAARIRLEAVDADFLEVHDAMAALKSAGTLQELTVSPCAARTPLTAAAPRLHSVDFPRCAPLRGRENEFVGSAAAATAVAAAAAAAGPRARS
eukprot:SM000194S04821  [mRNA]  locus=s194:96066:101852:+ [translate_table: standard]